jgi:kynurenine formamidase
VHDTSGAAVTADEVREAERVDGMRIEAGDIVLFRTGAGAYYGHHDYNERGRGLDPSVIELLCKRGVRVLGTDAWSIDPPFPVMRADIARRGPAAAWEAHYMGRHLQFCAIERLSQLELLPAHGFWVACFPVKVSGGSAGWTRAVAFVPGGQQ